MRHNLPSAGFVLLCGTIVLVAGLFIWGWSEPELDRVWRRLHALKIGEVGRLSSSDLALLRRTLARYPELGPALLDDQPAALISANTGGWVETERAYILALPGGERDPRVTVHWKPGEDQPQGPVVFKGSGANRVVALERPGTASLGLTKALRAGGLIEVRLEVAKGDAGEGLASGLQIVFPGEQEK